MPSISLPAEELNEFDLPRVCVVTGQTDNVEFKPVKFAWYPRWVSLLIVINVLLFAIVAYAMTRRVTGQLPFTEEAHEKWKRGRLFMPLSILGMVALILGGIALLSGNRTELGSVALIGSFLLPIIVYYVFVKGTGPVVERIDKGVITLKLPSDEAVVRIEQHLSSGARRDKSMALRSA